jgi:ABC-type sugar transport system ATPase subunit
VKRKEHGVSDDQSSQARAVVIEADSITKRFGGAVAVNDVSVSVRAGEIYALVGENGAGKSTLMRILAGVLEPTEGTVLVDGAPIEGGTRAAIDAGIALVHQELSLVPEMTVAENIMLGAFPTKGGAISRKEMRAYAGDALREIGVGIDLDEPVSRLSVSLRQFIEIARAVARKPRVLILDEPTATLTPAETDYLLQMLQRLAEGGLAIVYISHRLPEIFAICERVTVLRDGRLIDTMEIADVTPDALVDKMVGRELKRELEADRESNPGEVVLSARGVTAPKVNGIDLDVRAGEIVGLGGLVGAGRSEFVRAMLGVDLRTGGDVTVVVDGKVRRVGSYQQAVRHGIAFVPEERRHDGLALSMSVSDNIALPNRREISRGGVISPARQLAFAKQLADTVGLRPPNVKRDAGNYSGGNQQKVVIAKWLGTRPRVIVLDEPTRGVDVGAKAEIHRLVRELADQGTAVLVISSDLPELLELSDVIHVIRDGQVAGTLAGDQADERSVMSLAAGESMVTTS